MYVFDRAIVREQHEVWASGRGKIRGGEYFGKMKERRKKGNEKGSISKKTHKCVS
jgi:hypothetical protein